MASRSYDEQAHKERFSFTMPKQRIITVYSFEELSEEAQEKAIDKFRFANVDYEWWESVYEMSQEIGIKIKGFDIDAGIIKGELTSSFLDSFREIRKNWGRGSELYKTAKEYLNQYNKAYKEWKKDEEELTLDDFESEDGARVEEDYKRAILEDFLILLKKEYEYQTSDETVKEMIIDNEYEFEEDGTLYK